MEAKFMLLIVFAVSACARATSWNNLNCPAPRAPDNGLSFIFRNGELVHFRCHPGYQMVGKTVAYCVNNVWTQAAPECIPIRRRARHPNRTLDEDRFRYHNRHAAHQQEKWRVEKQRQLFSWGDQTKPNVYGDGPRRLPLINGIWPPQDHAEQVLALGPQSTPGPRTMVKEEVDIAELRNKQLEELKKQRHKSDQSSGKRRQGRKKNKRKNSVLIDESVPRETLLTLGSTEDGQALSVALAKAGNDNDKFKHKHRHHRGDRKKKNRDKKNKLYSVDAGYNNNNFITSRKSRVNTNGISPHQTRYQFNSPINNDVAELRRRPVEKVQPSGTTKDAILFSEFDTSCVENLYRRKVPMIARQVSNAFVYRYETKKNKIYPFNAYMEVKYKCFAGFDFVNKSQTLYCKAGSWIGEVPQCVPETHAVQA